MLNPNCELYVPTGTLEHAHTSTSPGLGDYDVKLFDPKDIHDMFGDKATYPVELDHELVQGTVYMMRHEGVYPPTEKKLLHPYWRYLVHVVTPRLSGRKGGYDVLNQTLSSYMVALALGIDFNYSKMIFRDMHANIKGKQIGTLGIKRMRDHIFPYMMMNKRGKKQYFVERPLVKFGRFAGLEE
ncbi:hypothetical protein R6Q57_013237 [Mikania cordata]